MCSDRVVPCCDTMAVPKTYKFCCVVIPDTEQGVIYHRTPRRGERMAMWLGPSRGHSCGLYASPRPIPPNALCDQTLHQQGLLTVG